MISVRISRCALYYNVRPIHPPSLPVILGLTGSGRLRKPAALRRPPPRDKKTPSRWRPVSHSLHSDKTRMRRPTASPAAAAVGPDPVDGDTSARDSERPSGENRPNSHPSRFGVGVAGEGTRNRVDSNPKWCTCERKMAPVCACSLMTARKRKLSLICNFGKTNLLPKNPLCTYVGCYFCA